MSVGRIPRGLKTLRGQAAGYMHITAEDLSQPLKFYRGDDGKIHAQATSSDENYGLIFKDEAAMQKAFIQGVTLERVPKRKDLEEKYGSYVEVFRSFDDQSARNAEAELKEQGIPYTLTRSKEGSEGQFNMVEFHVAPKDRVRAHQIIDEVVNL